MISSAKKKQRNIFIIQRTLSFYLKPYQFLHQPFFVNSDVNVCVCNLVKRRESVECDCCQGFIYIRIIEKYKRRRKIGEEKNTRKIVRVNSQSTSKTKANEYKRKESESTD